MCLEVFIVEFLSCCEVFEVIIMLCFVVNVMGIWICIVLGWFLCLILSFYCVMGCKSLEDLDIVFEGRVVFCVCFF